MEESNFDIKEGRRVEPSSVLATTTIIRNFLWFEQPVSEDLVRRLVIQAEALAYLVLAKRARWKMRRSWRVLTRRGAWLRIHNQLLPPAPPLPDVSIKQRRKRV